MKERSDIYGKLWRRMRLTRALNTPVPVTGKSDERLFLQVHCLKNSFWLSFRTDKVSLGHYLFAQKASSALPPSATKKTAIHNFFHDNRLARKEGPSYVSTAPNHTSIHTFFQGRYYISTKRAAFPEEKDKDPAGSFTTLINVVPGKVKEKAGGTIPNSVRTAVENKRQPHKTAYTIFSDHSNSDHSVTLFDKPSGIGHAPGPEEYFVRNIFQKEKNLFYRLNNGQNITKVIKREGTVTGPMAVPVNIREQGLHQEDENKTTGDAAVTINRRLKQNNVFTSNRFSGLKQYVIQDRNYKTVNQRSVYYWFNSDQQVDRKNIASQKWLLSSAKSHSTPKAVETDHHLITTINNSLKKESSHTTNLVREVVRDVTKHNKDNAYILDDLYRELSGIKNEITQIKNIQKRSEVQATIRSQVKAGSFHDF